MYLLPVYDLYPQTDVVYMTPEVCRNSVNESYYEARGLSITDNMVCAGAVGKGPCHGDSGGPLSYYDAATDSNVQMGIVSAGIACGNASFPAVFARVPNYLDWIESITDTNQFCSVGA